MRAFAFVALLLSSIGCAVATESWTAKVTGGRVRGAARSNGAQFLGMPYAAAPVGALRWKAPQAVVPWTGERDATRAGAASLQPDQGWNAQQRKHESEDCLFLNVLAPEWPAKASRPVLVYIHGGANVAGAGWDHLLEHTTLPEHGVVLVSLNYRLGVFGFLAHPELTAESPHGASGNYALMDQIAALEWVRDNIATFGGDPKRVTVMGQSAGAQDIGLLLASPRARGLFAGAIMESGPLVTLAFDYAPRADAEKAGVALAEKIGKKNLTALRAMPADELIAAAAMGDTRIGPCVDGWVLTEKPAETFASGRAAAVPVIVGSNAREFPFHGSAEDLRKQIRGTFGDLGPRALALYGVAEGQAMPAMHPVLGGAGDQFLSDVVFRMPMEFAALWQSAAGHAVWRYQFSRTPIGKESAGAGHSAELPYVFGEMVPNELGADYNAADKALGEAIQRYWVNFAATGNPNEAERGAGTARTLPEWPRYDGERRAYVEFEEAGVREGEGLRREMVDLFKERMAEKEK